MRKSLSLLFLAILAALPLATALAQGDLDNTYVSANGTFTFSYPRGWYVDEEDEYGTVGLRAVEYSVAAIVYSPDALSDTGISTEDLIVLLEEMLPESEGLEWRGSKRFDLEGRAAARLDYVAMGRKGYLLAVTLADGMVSMIGVLGSVDGVDDSEADILAIAASMEAITYLPQALHDYDARWQDAIAELRDAGLISYGGDLVFLEDRAYFAGQGSFYTPLARNRPYANVVMAGELNFTVGNTDEFESCSLGARIVGNNQGDVLANVDVGINNDGQIYYADLTGDEDTSTFDIAWRTGVYETPHHFLLLLLGDRLTVYFDGELIFENAPVEERAGFYGVGLNGRGVAARCVAHNIWAYHVPVAEPGMCAVTVTRNVNQRSGPGTTYDTVGQLTPGNSPAVRSFTMGSDGYRWWQLADNSWVRDDVVQVVGDCADVPEFGSDSEDRQPLQDARQPGTFLAWR